MINGTYVVIHAWSWLIFLLLPLFSNCDSNFHKLHQLADTHLVLHFIFHYITLRYHSILQVVYMYIQYVRINFMYLHLSHFCEINAVLQYVRVSNWNCIMHRMMGNFCGSKFLRISQIDCDFKTFTPQAFYL